MNNKLDEALENRPKFNKVFPELGSSRGTSKHRARGREILSFENVEPKRFIRGGGHDLPPPFDDQSFVHDKSINNTQPPKAFCLQIMSHLIMRYLRLLSAAVQ